MFPESEYSGSRATESRELNRLTNVIKSDKTFTQFPKPDRHGLGPKRLILYYY